MVGGGIAGLSAAHHLSRERLGAVLLLEREGVLCTHSSGRNAAIFLELSSGPGDVALARRSRPMLDELLPGWLSPCGTLMVASDGKSLEPLLARAEREGVRCGRMDRRELLEAAPALEGGNAKAGLFCPGDGVMDVHGVSQALARGIRARGGRIECGAEVAAVEAKGGRLSGVKLASGERVSAGTVVLCGGAWAGELGGTAGAPLSMVPLRRHLAVLVPPEKVTGLQVVWSVDADVYFRPESGGFLASPCDEEPWPPGLPPASQAGLERLAEKLSKVAPALSRSEVRRAWACLRTFAKDRAAVVGADPRVRGLHWMAGLGGHGMTGGLAAGEVLAAAVAGRSDPLGEVLSPVRLLPPPPAAIRRAERRSSRARR